MGYILLHFKQGQSSLVVCTYELNQVYHFLIEKVVQDLLARKYIKNGDIYKSFIVPRYDSQPRFGNESVRQHTWFAIKPTLEELNGNRKGWLSEEQLQKKPMAYFSLSICPAPSSGSQKGLVYQRDFPMSDLQPFVEQETVRIAAERNWPRDRLQAAEWIMTMHPDIPNSALLNDQLILVVNPQVRELSPLSPELPPPPVISSDQSDQMDVALRRRPKLHRLVGDPQPGELQVYIHRQAIDMIKNVARYAFNNELAGVLVGQPGQDVESGDVFLEVMDVIPARHTQATDVSVTFTPKTWENIRSMLSASHPDKQVVGWYHIHLKGELFSEKDHEQHTRHFSHPLQIALVFGAINQQIVLYRVDSAVEHILNGFYEV